MSQPRLDASELMEILFWIDEFNPGMINLFQLETYPGEKCNSSEDTAVRYHDSDRLASHIRLLVCGLIMEFSMIF